MPFDLSSVLNQAQEVTSNSFTENNDRPRILYPGIGTIKVKIFYNPKSNLVSRIIRRHKVGDTNYTCLSMFGQDCPICKTIENIHNSTGADLWKYSAKPRGISYAQYVGSENYRWDQDEPQTGSLVLLMYPWMVYQDINRIISSAGAHAEELIAKNEGKILNISHYMENGRHAYKVEVDAFALSFKSCANEDEFEKYLNNLPDLNETIVPSVMSSSILKLANDAAEVLARGHLRGVDNAMSGGFNNQALSGLQTYSINGQQYVNIDGQMVLVQENTPMSNQSSATSSTSNNEYVNIPEGVTEDLPFEEGKTNITPDNQEVSTSTPTTADGQQLPECFGKHKDGDPKCMGCLNEIACMTLQ